MLHRTYPRNFLGSEGLTKTVARVAIAGVFLVTGTLHFLRPEAFVRIVPPMLPWPRALVYVSGLCELAGAVGLLIPRVRQAAAYGLVALLIAVFPANIYMAVAHVSFGGWLDQPLYHWIRLPFQAVLIAWVLWSATARPGQTQRRAGDTQSK